jgi:glycerol uptake facilitator-like aquaporin
LARFRSFSAVAVAPFWPPRFRTAVSVGLVVGGWALADLWMFWVAPIIGAALAGIAYRAVAAEQT